MTVLRKVNMVGRSCKNTLYMQWFRVWGVRVLRYQGFNGTPVYLFHIMFLAKLGKVKSKYYVKEDTSQQISNGRCLRMLRSDIFLIIYISISQQMSYIVLIAMSSISQRYCGLGRSPLRILCFLLACDIDDPALVMAGYGWWWIFASFSL